MLSPFKDPDMIAAFVAAFFAVIYGILLIGIIGFLAAALMGVWLLVAILRKGRL